MSKVQAKPLRAYEGGQSENNGKITSIGSYSVESHLAVLFRVHRVCNIINEIQVEYHLPAPVAYLQFGDVLPAARHLCTSPEGDDSLGLAETYPSSIHRLR